MKNRMNEDKEKIQNLLKAAQWEKKHDWNVYNSYKNQIDSLLLTYDEYSSAIKKLCDILKV